MRRYIPRVITIASFQAMFFAIGNGIVKMIPEYSTQSWFVIAFIMGILGVIGWRWCENYESKKDDVTEEFDESVDESLREEISKDYIIDILGAMKDPLSFNAYPGWSNQDIDMIISILRGSNVETTKEYIRNELIKKRTMPPTIFPHEIPPEKEM